MLKRDYIEKVMDITKSLQDQEQLGRSMQASGVQNGVGWTGTGESVPVRLYVLKYMPLF